MARNNQRRGERRENRDGYRNDYRNEYRPSNSRDDYRNGPRPPPSDYRDYRDAPASLPPRPPSRGYENKYRPQGHGDNYRSRDDSSYRPQSNGYGSANRVPPPPRSPPPPPPGHSQSYSTQPPRGDFTFRVDKPAGVEQSTDSYRPNGVGSRAAGGARDGRDRAIRRGDRRNDRFRGKTRGPWRPFVAAERELLNARHSSATEHVMFNSDNEVKYKAIEELSDSDEAEMDISGDEGEQDREPSHKRVRLTEEDAAAEANSLPKWSNPDPYTALPPPDTVTNQKKKDVVQLIRKARVDAKEAKSTLPTEAADYISFDFDDSDDGEGEVQPGPREVPRPTVGAPGVPGAPTGPKSAGDPHSSSKSKNGPASLPPRPPVSARQAAVDLDEHKRVIDFTGSPDSSNQKNSTKSVGKRAAVADTTSALGSRKRTHDDKIKLPDHARLKKVVKMAAHGDLIGEWKIVQGEDSCPWNTNDHSDTPVIGVWLHKEIVDFYEHVKPQDFEDKIRGQVVEDLQVFCRNMYGKRISVLPFGSYPSGLYLPTGDMDLVLVSDQYAKDGRRMYGDKKTLFRLQGALRNHSMAHLNEIEVITRAKVPLVKYIEKRSGLRMDISFENLTGVQAIKTFKAWKEQYPAMPIIVTLIKHFLAMRGLNEPVNGGIGGFSVICLVVSMLQMMPQVQSQNMNPAHHLGDLLMEFFDLYGNRFNFNEVAISLNPPKYIPKNKVTAFPYNQTNRFSIIDPNNPENDISGGSSNTARIVKSFSDAYAQLHGRMETIAGMSDKQGASILEVILAGNYSSFRLQREHLRKLHDRGLDYEALEQGPRRPKW